MDNSNRKFSRLYFDQEDYDILEIINPVITGKKKINLLRNLFDPALHPRGIKELAALKPLRVACAVFDLVNSFEGKDPVDRINALRSVREEVLHNGSQQLKKNTARVLLQIMKTLVRANGNELLQLQLANDFRQATSGKPRLIREQLKKYHLLEMPEEWCQRAFDHHVHDANSKGRKSPTHLIMDAWIKGIRDLVVIYYNSIQPADAAELLEAAEIMDVNIRIGVEFSAKLRNKPVQLIWAPRGFKNREDFVSFLQSPSALEFLSLGKAVSVYETEILLENLNIFCLKYLPQINKEFDLAVPDISADDFVKFISKSQPSLLHLADFLHASIVGYMEKKAEELIEQCRKAPEEERNRIKQVLSRMDNFISETILEKYLVNQETGTALKMIKSNMEVPELLNIGVRDLLLMIEKVPRGSRIILNPSNLTAAEVLEVLYEGEGKITHLEIFNLKDWAEGKNEHREMISKIRMTINSGNISQAKQLVLSLITRLETCPDERERESVEPLRNILRNIVNLQGFYRYHHLKSRIGSDSTGRVRHSRGMGLIAMETLTRRAQKAVVAEDRLLPVRTNVLKKVTWRKLRSSSLPIDWFYRSIRYVPVLNQFGYELEVDWFREPNSTFLDAKGNIASLGGVPEDACNGFLEKCTEKEVTEGEQLPGNEYLTTPLKNLIKILIGFVPAFLTFFLTKDWWFFAWFGALIWFGITGSRNIIQSVFGGGGIFRSSLLKWNDFISWGRISDSLLFTGFSVPILDYFVKSLILNKGFSITIQTSPILLYSIIALANGIYISSHNIFRGLPSGAVIGNFFRTVLSIPLAIILNAVVGKILVYSGASPDSAMNTLQLWAAVISKTSSDVVGGIIEGLADRAANLSMRTVDFNDKLASIQDVQGRLEMLFPEKDILEMLEDPKLFYLKLKDKNESIMKDIAINALDCMYIWMLQPRGRHMFKHLLNSVSSQERQFFIAIQRVLRRKRELSRLFIDGLVGKRFDRALSMYLSLSDSYLKQLERLELKFRNDECLAVSA